MKFPISLIKPLQPRTLLTCTRAYANANSSCLVQVSQPSFHGSIYYINWSWAVSSWFPSSKTFDPNSLFFFS